MLLVLIGLAFAEIGVLFPVLKSNISTRAERALCALAMRQRHNVWLGHCHWGQFVDTSEQYTAIQRKLHWVVVIIIASQYLSQSPMKSAMDNLWGGGALSGFDFFITTLHTWGGAAVGAIMVYRLRLRLKRPVPVGAGGLFGWQKMLAESLHWVFYGVLFLMAITGMLHYYLELHFAAKWHVWGEWLLLGLIAAHVLAALLHQFYKKDAVMRQMWGSRPPH